MIVYPKEAKDERNPEYQAHNPPDPGENTNTGVVSFSARGKIAVPSANICVLILASVPEGTSQSFSCHFAAFGGSHEADLRVLLLSIGYQN